MQKKPTGFSHEASVLFEQIMLDHLLHLFSEFLFRHVDPSLLFLPETVAQQSPKLLLNPACRSGEWACGLARRYPALDIIGVDHRQLFVRDAQMGAAIQGLENVSFFEQDLFPLSERQESYPVVAGQFLSSAPLEKRQALLKAMVHACAPGGSVLLFEATLPQTSSEAANQWIALLRQDVFPSTPFEHLLPSLTEELMQAGCTSIHHQSQRLDISYGTAPYQTICEQIRSAFHLSSIVLLAYNHISLEQLSTLRTQVVLDLLANVFHGEWGCILLMGTKEEATHATG